MFSSAKELLEYCIKNNVKISAAIIDDEAKTSEKSKGEVMERMRQSLEVMRSSASQGLEKDIKSISGLIGGDAKRINDNINKNKTLCGSNINKAMARAFSSSEVNSAMGRIVAAPTAGSCGILPAVIITAAENFNSTEEEIVNSLFTASAVGAIIAGNATLSGAEGGCQAECGSASAMAAAACVELAGGTPEMSFHAAAIAIKCILGLVCDPIAGLVEAPCAKRNAMGSVNAMAAADMALAGVKSIIPFDEVVDAMYRIGKSMPFELRETSLGGLAATPTGIKLHKEIF
ncbi:L-serine dehydratase, alpha chain [Oxobacter pfennigii]|uniref:L-serine dehydratase n=1 Tax=Oxobacter pfennigii TaxID=36849 RepID=A0A0P8YD50_9CLOT|nr:L-serine ammonia-lyase, iron-sulfur-dependent, subunit alpha [Oxobacter pfennigii]KPU45163.1 L-serine dehydratase, alpha chain [Oxobacter pfennigii]